jgi:hypothetical protein
MRPAENRREDNWESRRRIRENFAEIFLTAQTPAIYLDGLAIIAYYFGYLTGFQTSYKIKGGIR